MDRLSQPQRILVKVILVAFVLYALLLSGALNPIFDVIIKISK